MNPKKENEWGVTKFLRMPKEIVKRVDKYAMRNRRSWANAIAYLVEQQLNELEKK